MTRSISLDTLTVGDLRAILNYDGGEQTTIADALEQMQTATANSVEADAAARELRLQVEAWVAGRGAVIREAFDAANESAKKEQKGWPAAHAEGQEAATAAAERYERSTPVPRDPAGRPAVAYEYYNPDEGLVRGAVERVKALVS